MNIDELKKKFNISDSDIEILKEYFDDDIVVENIVSFSEVYKSRNIKLEKYLKAVKYVTLLSYGKSVVESWCLVHPKKCKEIEEKYDKETSEKRKRRYAYAYDKTSLVLELKKLLIVPTYIMYHDIYNEAIMKQAELMRNAKSEMVRHQSAKALMEFLKPPEENALNINVSVEKKNVLNELEKQLLELTNKQIKQLENDVIDVKEIVELEIKEKIE